MLYVSSCFDWSLDFRVDMMFLRETTVSLWLESYFETSCSSTWWKAITSWMFPSFAPFYF